MAYFRCKFGKKEPEPDYLYYWDFTKSITDKVQNKQADIYGNATRIDGEGVKITGGNGYVQLFPDFIPTTQTEDIVMELEMGDMQKTFNSPMGLIASFKSTSALGVGYYNSEKWAMINTNDSIDDIQNPGIDITDPEAFKNATLKFVFHNNISLDIYKNRVHVGFIDYHTRYSANNVFRLIGGYQSNYPRRRSYYNFTVKKAKIYYQPV